MEMAAEEQGHLGPDPEVRRQDDVTDIDRDDEFDFEIGGEDDLGAAVDADDANGNLIYQADGPETHDDDSYTYHPEEQAAQAALGDSYDEQGHDRDYEDLNLEVSAFETETVDFTESAQDDGQDGHEILEQGETEEHVEDDSFGQELYYEETTGESQSIDNAVQPEADQDHDLMNTATSVDCVQGGVDLQGPAQETQADEDQAEADIDAIQETKVFEETADKAKATGEHDDEEHAQSANVAAKDAENGHVGDDSGDASLAGNEPSTEVGDESHWDTEDHENQPSNAHPNVSVFYRGQEYFLFAEAPDEDPNTYFLDEVDSIHRPLSQFLGNVRAVISSEVEAGDEIFMKIDGLGLEFGESTTKDFLDQMTFARIIEVNNKLVQHDGGSQSPELYIYLSVRSNPLLRFTELARGADEGQGLSNFEKHYDEASADVSATNEEEQDEVSRDIVSDDFSLDESYDEPEEVQGGPPVSRDVQQYHNPFRVDEDQQQLLTDAFVSGIAGVEAAAQEALTADSEAPHAFDGRANGSAEAVDGGEHSGLEVDSTYAQEVSIENTLGDVVSISGQVEEVIVESCGDGHDVDGPDGQGSTNGGEAQEPGQQAEVLIDFSHEGHERTDDLNDNAADDDDYLDLGDNGDHEQPADHAGTTNGNGAENFDTTRQLSHHSSATATLNGEDNGHGDDAAATQDLADPSCAPDQADFETSQPEVDEIDWNHDEDDEIGVADQDSTDLSPSRLSAKRSREEDEGADGLGDENAVKRRRT